MDIDHLTSTRIPVNDDYASIVGKAVYVFAYYEWIIICIIDALNKGFVNEYSRPTKKAYTSGSVKRKLRNAIDTSTNLLSQSTLEDMEKCFEAFSDLIEKRNALIHAHPITHLDNSQILASQTKSSKAISDMIWPQSEVEKLISEIDNSALLASEIFTNLNLKS
jgi:hypothetical protein